MLSLDIIDKDILDLETNHDTTWATVERLAWLYNSVMRKIDEIE